MDDKQTNRIEAYKHHLRTTGVLGEEDKQRHLQAFIKQVLGKPTDAQEMRPGTSITEITTQPLLKTTKEIL